MHGNKAFCGHPFKGLEYRLIKIAFIVFTVKETLKCIQNI